MALQNGLYFPGGNARCTINSCLTAGDVSYSGITMEALVKPAMGNGNYNIVFDCGAGAMQLSGSSLTNFSAGAWVCSTPGYDVGGQPTYYYSVGTIAANTWYRFSVVLSKGSTNVNIKLYWNGTQIGATTNSGIANTSWYCNGYGGIGGVYSTGGSYNYYGDIDDVRLWGIAQTAANISADKNIELTGNEANLLHYWKLDEQAGTSCSDSANATDATAYLQSGVTWVAPGTGTAFSSYIIADTPWM